MRIFEIDDETGQGVEMDPNGNPVEEGVTAPSSPPPKKVDQGQYESPSPKKPSAPRFEFNGYEEEIVEPFCFQPPEGQFASYTQGDYEDEDTISNEGGSFGTASFGGYTPLRFQELMDPYQWPLTPQDLYGNAAFNRSKDMDGTHNEFSEVQSEYTTQNQLKGARKRYGQDQTQKGKARKQSLPFRSPVSKILPRGYFPDDDDDDDDEQSNAPYKPRFGAVPPRTYFPSDDARSNMPYKSSFNEKRPRRYFP